MSNQIPYERDSPLGLALERAWQSWAEGPCHELGCGCITVEMWDQVAHMVDSKFLMPNLTQQEKANEERG